MSREAAKIRSLDGLATVEAFRGDVHISGQSRVQITLAAGGRSSSMYFTPGAARRLARTLFAYAKWSEQRGDDE